LHFRTGMALRQRRTNSICVAVLTLAACGGDSGPPAATGPDPVATVEVSPSSLSLFVGQTSPLAARTRDKSGTLLESRTVTWTSSDVNVAAVSTTGDATGVGAGTATVYATSEGKTGTAIVTVRLAPVAGVVVEPASMSLVVRQTGTLVATPRNEAGNALSGRVVAWSSSDANVASVSPAGVVTGVAAGTATITATSETKAGTAAITVTQGPLTVTLENWTSIGPHHINGPLGILESGKLQAFAVFDANPNIMYAGGGLGSGNQGPFSEAGAFATRDGGSSWLPINTGLVDPTINALWVDQANANAVLAGTESAGIFRSTNGGQTWSLVSGVGTTSDFVSTGGKVYAASAAGVAQSADGGATWSIALATPSRVRALAAGGGAMIAGLENGTIMMQSSASAAWQNVRTNPGRIAWSVAIDPANPLTAYALVGFHPSTVLGTSDGGVTWSTITPCSLAQAVAMTTSTHVLYVGCNGQLVSSSNAGRSWTTIQNVSWDIRRLRVLSDETTILLGTDQGLFRTTNSGAVWTGISGNVYSSLLTGISVRRSTMFTAVQDFSPIVSFDGGNNWQQPSGVSPNPPIGEDGTVLINPGNASYCYAYTTSGYQYSTDGCRAFRAPAVAGLGSLSYVQPGGANIMAIDPRAPSTVYAASQNGVFRSVDWGVTMTPTNWPITQATAVAVDPSDSRVIYVGTSSTLFATQDGGTTWSELSLAGSAGYPTTVAVDPVNTQVVLVGLSQGPTRGGGILRSTNRGTSFTRVNAGLSAKTAVCCGVDILSLRFDPSGVVAAATSTGLFVSADLGDRWQDVTGSAVSSYFTDVAWDEGALYASTYGSGVLRASVSLLPGSGAASRSTTSARPSSTRHPE
jgi:hypothetical protein